MGRRNRKIQPAKIVAILLSTVAILAGTPASSQNVYFGTLHSHTSYSDGSGTPKDAYKAAEDAGMDFIAITEHNHADAERGAKDRRDGLLIATNPKLYRGQPSSLVEAAAKANRDGKFIALYGQEFSTISSGNHVNVFDAPSVIDAQSGHFDQLLKWVAVHPDTSGRAPLLQFNHPEGSDDPAEYGRDDFPSEGWVAKMDPFVELIEVLNAPALNPGTGFRPDRKESQYFTYLNYGFHVGPSVGHDNHYRNWGVSTDARIGVIAGSLTKTALIEALRQRHTFASEDKNMRVIFRIGAALGGDIIPLPAGGGDLDATIDIADPDEPTANYRIDVFIDTPGGDRAYKPVETFRQVGNTSGPLRLDGIRKPAARSYVLLRVTQSASEDDQSEDRAWTAPVWFETPAGPMFAAMGATSAVRIASLVANPAGDDFQNENVTLRNDGSGPADLTGWRLRDLAQNEWTLDTVGVLQPGELRAVTRAGQPMSLNNDGDTIELVQPDGRPVQTLSYGPVTIDEVVLAP